MASVLRQRQRHGLIPGKALRGRGAKKLASEEISEDRKTMTVPNECGPDWEVGLGRLRAPGRCSEQRCGHDA